MTQDERADEPQAKESKQGSSGSVDKMVLIRGEYRRADDHEPDVKRPSCPARQMYRVESPEDDEERDME